MKFFCRDRAWSYTGIFKKEFPSNEQSYMAMHSHTGRLFQEIWDKLRSWSLNFDQFPSEKSIKFLSDV